jgi:hypothetical protein
LANIAPVDTTTRCTPVEEVTEESRRIWELWDLASSVYCDGISLAKLHLRIALYGGISPCYFHYEIPATEFSFRVYKRS